MAYAIQWKGSDHAPARPALVGGKIPRAHALGLAVTGGVLSSTGIALAAFRYVVPDADAFSAYPHPWWRFVVMAHVIAVPGFFFFVGSVWWRHVVRHWRNDERRWSGASVVTALAAVSVSGYALYFVGSEAALAIWRAAHAGAGLVGIGASAWHAVAGFRALRGRKSSDS